MSWLRQVRGRLRDYATLANLYWSELETWVSHKVRPRRDALQAVRPTESGPDGDDESHQEKFQELTRGIHINVGVEEIETIESQGFINAQGYPGVVLVFKVDAAMCVAAAPMMEPSQDTAAFSAYMMHIMASHLFGQLMDVVDPDMEFDVFGEPWTIRKMLDDD